MSNTLHNAIMEAGGKDHLPMLAPGNYNPQYKFTWAAKEVPISEGSSVTTTERGAGYANQRLCDVAGARDIVGTTVVQKSRIQCYIYEDFGHVARECQKLKRAKDAAYHREKMLLFHDTYPIEQDEHNVIINSLDMSYDNEQIDQNDDDDDLANEQTNKLIYNDLKKSQAELDRRNDVEYSSKVEID
nr:hypothetical protein [Tanacetum cinerariifolium]